MNNNNNNNNAYMHALRIIIFVGFSFFFFFFFSFLFSLFVERRVLRETCVLDASFTWFPYSTAVEIRGKCIYFSILAVTILDERRRLTSWNKLWDVDRGSDHGIQQDVP